MSTEKEIIVITGATASGKTKLAIDLALKINAEIICADSRSVYKDLDIVSAKVEKAEMQGIRHHLLDIITPNDDYSASDFERDARNIVDEIILRNKKVIVAGGTWFYIKALLEDCAMPEVSEDKELRQELELKSNDEAWEILNKLDSKRAQEVHKNNKDKVIRSIEMCKGLNMPVSQYVRPKKEQKYSAKWYMPKISREQLYENINKRVDIMVEMGLYDEFLKNKRQYPNSKVLLNTIGYKEFFELEDGTHCEFNQAVDKIKQRTRNFAKRQLTYFRSNSDIIEVSCVDEIPV